MKPVKQRTVNPQYGDCFSACLASLLELPIEVVPNDHSEQWFPIVRLFLSQFGLALSFHNAQSPIWDESPWIASVRSNNFAEVTHAIIMQNGEVLFDPSTKVRHKKGTSLLGSKIVIGGYIMRVSDFSLLHKLKEYRDKLTSKHEVTA